MNAESVLMLFAVSVVFLSFVAFFLWRFRTLELKLLALGLVTALLAVWCGQSGQVGASVHVGPVPGGEAGRVFVGSESAGTLGRIAFVLVLGGVAMSILSQGAFPGVATSKEETTRENPV
jgi:hypothetical protein